MKIGYHVYASRPRLVTQQWSPVAGTGKWRCGICPTVGCGLSTATLGTSILSLCLQMGHSAHLVARIAKPTCGTWRRVSSSVFVTTKTSLMHCAIVQAGTGFVLPQDHPSRFGTWKTTARWMSCVLRCWHQTPKLNFHSAYHWLGQLMAKHCLLDILTISSEFGRSQWASPIEQNCSKKNSLHPASELLFILTGLDHHW